MIDDPGLTDIPDKNIESQKMPIVSYSDLTSTTDDVLPDDPMGAASFDQPAQSADPGLVDISDESIRADRERQQVWLPEDPTAPQLETPGQLQMPRYQPIERDVSPLDGYDLDSLYKEFNEMQAIETQNPVRLKAMGNLWLSAQLDVDPEKGTYDGRVRAYFKIPKDQALPPLTEVIRKLQGVSRKEMDDPNYQSAVDFILADEEQQLLQSTPRRFAAADPADSKIGAIGQQILDWTEDPGNFLTYSIQEKFKETEEQATKRRESMTDKQKQRAINNTLIKKLMSSPKAVFQVAGSKDKNGNRVYSDDFLRSVERDLMYDRFSPQNFKHNLNPHEQAFYFTYLKALNPARAEAMISEIQDTVKDSAIRAALSFEKTGDSFYEANFDSNNPEHVYRVLRDRYTKKDDRYGEMISSNGIFPLFTDDMKFSSPEAKAEVKDMLTQYIYHKRLIGAIPVASMPYQRPAEQEAAIRSGIRKSAEAEASKIVEDIQFYMRSGKQYDDYNTLQQQFKNTTRREFQKRETLPGQMVAAASGMVVDLGAAMALGAINPALAMAYPAIRFHGEHVKELQAHGLSIEEAQTQAAPTTVLYAGIEFLQVRQLKGVDDLFTGAFKKGITKLTPIHQKFASGWAAGIYKYMMDYATRAIIETTEEGLQAMVEAAGKAYAKEFAGAHGISYEDLLDQVGLEIIEAAKGMPLIALGGTGARISRDAMTGNMYDADLANSMRDTILDPELEKALAVYQEAVQTFATQQVMEEFIAAETIEEKQAIVEQLKAAGIDTTLEQAEEVVNRVQEQRIADLQATREAMHNRGQEQQQLATDSAPWMDAFNMQLGENATVESTAQETNRDTWKITSKEGFTLDVEIMPSLADVPNLPAEYQEDAAKNNTNGMFYEGKIYLKEGAEAKTLVHELLHAMKKINVISQQDYDTLLDAARESLGQEMVEFIETEYKRIYEKSLKKGEITPEELQERINEELVAKLVEDAQEKGIPEVLQQQGIWQKMMNWAKDLVSKVTRGMVAPSKASQQSQAIEDVLTGKPLQGARMGEDITAEIDEQMSSNEAMLEKAREHQRSQGKTPKFSVEEGFEEELDDIDGEGELVVVHNLSENNLVAADELGGLPAPSIAIVRSDLDEFGSFGDISLIANPELIDPEYNPTFNADVYSPRQPRAVYQENYVEMKRLKDDDSTYLKDKGLEALQRYYDGEFQERGYSAFYKAYGLMLKFLEEAKGVTIDPVYKQQEKGINIPQSLDKHLPVEFKQTEGNSQREQFIKEALNQDDEFFTELALWANSSGLTTMHPEKIKENFDKLKSEDPEIFIQGKRMVSAYASRLFAKAKLKSESLVDTVDVYKTRDEIELAIDPFEFKPWLEKEYPDMVESKQLFLGHQDDGTRIYKEYTLQNVVDFMTAEKLQGGEGFNYGVGTVRSQGAKQFNSLDEMKADQHKIVKSEDLATEKDGFENLLVDLIEAIKPYYKYSAEGFHYMDAGSQMIGELAAGNYQEFNTDFPGVPAELMQELESFIEDLTTAPTEYFETKMQRAVTLDEFAAALVPKGANKAKAILEEKGLRVYEYEGARDFASQDIKDLRFSVDLPETIQVNGKEKSTRNNQDNFIAGSIQEIENFYKWFDNSKAVDKKGRPIVLYHGSLSAGWGQFYSTHEIYLTRNRSIAATYAGKHKGIKADEIVPPGQEVATPSDWQPGIYELYLRTETPLIVDGKGANWFEIPAKNVPLDLSEYDLTDFKEQNEAVLSTNKIVEFARKDWKIDGVIFENIDDLGAEFQVVRERLERDNENISDIYVAIDSNQIKSVNFNNGEFDKNSNDIRFSVEVPGTIETLDDAETKKTITTGQPIELDFIRRTGGTENFGATYGQDIEPAGRFFRAVSKESKSRNQEHFKDNPEFVHGTLKFDSPLILEDNTEENPDSMYNQNGWKARLSAAYDGLTGEALTNAILKDGYDAVLTVSELSNGTQYLSESVDLTYQDESKNPDIRFSINPERAAAITMAERIMKNKKGEVSNAAMMQIMRMFGLDDTKIEEIHQRAQVIAAQVRGLDQDDNTEQQNIRLVESELNYEEEVAQALGRERHFGQMFEQANETSRKVRKGRITALRQSPGLSENLKQYATAAAALVSSEDFEAPALINLIEAEIRKHLDEKQKNDPAYQQMTVDEFQYLQEMQGYAHEKQRQVEVQQAILLQGGLSLDAATKEALDETGVKIPKKYLSEEGGLSWDVMQEALEVDIPEYFAGVEGQYDLVEWIDREVNAKIKKPDMPDSMRVRTDKMLEKAEMLGIMQNTMHDIARLLIKELQPNYRKGQLEKQVAALREPSLQYKTLKSRFTDIAVKLNKARDTQQIKDAMKMIKRNIDKYKKPAKNKQLLKTDKRKDKKGNTKVTKVDPLTARYMRLVGNVWRMPQEQVDSMVEELTDMLNNPFDKRWSEDNIEAKFKSWDIPAFKDHYLSADQIQEDGSIDHTYAGKQKILLNVLKQYGALRWKSPAEVLQAAHDLQAVIDGSQAKLEEEINRFDKANERIREILLPAIQADGRKISDLTKGVNSVFGASYGMRSMFEAIISNSTGQIREDARAELEKLLDMVNEADHQRRIKMLEISEEVVQAVADIYGTNDAYGELSQLSKLKEEYGEKYSNFKNSRLSKLHLMQILGFTMQQDYQENSKKHRKGQREQITAELTEQDLEFMQWFKDYYSRTRERLSAKTMQVLGLPIEMTDPNYLPVRVDYVKPGMKDTIQVTTIVPPSYNTRKAHLHDVRETSTIFDMFLQRAEETEHFLSSVETMQTLTAVFGHPDIVRAIEDSVGRYTADMFYSSVSDWINLGYAAAPKIPALDKLRTWFTFSKFALNARIGIKQMTSIPAFGFEIGLANTATHLASAFSAEGMEAMKEIYDHPLRKERAAAGTTEDIRHALSMKPARTRVLFAKAMIFNIYGDIVPSLLIGQGIYRSYTQQYMESGMTLEEAKEKAMSKTFQIIESTQQSGNIKDQAYWQRRGGTLGKAMSIFTNTTRQYLEKELVAIQRTLANPKDKDNWKKLGNTVVINHLLLPAAYNGMNMFINTLLGEDHDEDDAWMMLAMMLAGPASGYIFFGSIIVGLSEVLITGSRGFGGKGYTPMVGIMDDALTAGELITADDLDDAQKQMMRLLKSNFAPAREVSRAYKNYGE